MDRFAQLFARHRGLIAALVVLATLVSFYGITQLRFDDDPRIIFKTKQDDYQRLEEQFAEFGSDDNDCVLVVQADDLFTSAAVAAMRRLVHDVSEVEGVERVVSILDAKRDSGVGRSQIGLIPPDDATLERLERARQQAMVHPLVAGHLLAEDGRTTLVIAKLSGESQALTPMEPTVLRLLELAKRQTDAGTLHVRLTGVPPIRVAITRNIEKDLLKFNVVGMVLAVGIAYAVFRQISAVIIVIAAPAVGAIWVLGTLGLAGVSINVLNAVVPTLVMVVGLTDSVHFLLDIKRSRAAQLGELESSLASIVHVGVACGLTSLTSAVGFASLVVARADIVRGFGLACSLGSVLCFLAVMTIVPLLASTRLSRNLGDARDREARFASWANAVVRWATTWPRTVTAVGIATTLGLGLTAIQLKPDSWLTENLPSHHEASQALAHCDRAFGGVLFVYALVQWPEDQTLASDDVHQALEDVHKMFRDRGDTRNPMSVLNVAQSLPADARRNWPASVRYMERGADDLSGLWNSEKHSALVSARVQDTGAAQAVPAVHDLQQQLAEIQAKYPRLKLRLSGTTVVASENITGMIGDLGSSLGLESFVIFALMTWSFRSLGLGLISIIPNVFPLVAVASLMVFLGMPLQFGSVIVFNICLGLAVDDTIHVMTRFRSERAKGGDTRTAIRRSFSSVGTAVLTTTCILLAGFGVVMLSEIPALRLFGMLSCVTILAALIAELIFTPALLLTFLERRYTTADSPDALFAGRLTERELDLLELERPGCPQTIFARLLFGGRLKRAALSAAFGDLLADHPRLTSQVRGTGTERRWEVAAEGTVPLVWLGARADSGLPGAGHIDLETQWGWRGWVSEDADDSVLILQVHEACGGVAQANQWIRELLAAYAIRLVDCDHVHAAHVETTTEPVLRNGQGSLPRQWVHRWRIWSRRPLALSDGHHPGDVGDDYPAIFTEQLSTDEVQSLEAVAREQNCSVAAVCVRDLFLTLNLYLAAYRPHEPEGWLRLLVRRDAADRPIAIDRVSDDLSPGRLLVGIENDLAGAAGCYKEPPATAHLAFSRNPPTGPLPREKGRLVVGNVVLERWDWIYPTKSAMPATFGLSEYAGELSISLHFDSSAIDPDAAAELLQLYVQRLRSARGSAIIEPVEQPQVAPDGQTA